MTLDLILTPETRAIYEALRLVPLGETIRYDALTKLIGIDVTGPARARLASAMRIALRDDGAAFQTVRGVGLRRLLPDEAPDIGTAARRRIRRSSQRAVRDMTRASRASNGLSPDAQRRLNAELSMHGLISEIATEKATVSLQKNESVTAPVVSMEAIMETLKAMK